MKNYRFTFGFCLGWGFAVIHFELVGDTVLYVDIIRFVAYLISIIF